MIGPAIKAKRDRWVLATKVAQKAVAPGVVILPEALGVNISGVITSAIFAGVFVSLLR